MKQISVLISLTCLLSNFLFWFGEFAEKLALETARLALQVVTKRLNLRVFRDQVFDQPLEPDQIRAQPKHK